MVSLNSGMKLKARHLKRKPSARKLDEKETHRITISLKDNHPRAAANLAQWRKAPGSLDIIEIDSPNAIKNLAVFKNLKKQLNNAPAVDLSHPGKPPGLTIPVPKFPSGKPKVSKANLKKLDRAAGFGPVELTLVGSEIEENLQAVSRKAAVKAVVEDLMKQIDVDGIFQTVENVSAQPEVVAQVASGELIPPSQKKVSNTQVDKLEADWKAGKEKNWDNVLKKVSGKKGTNEGGLYMDKDAQTYHYVKWPKTANHARMEYLANQLYNLTGVPVPSVRVIKFGGKTAIMSDWLEDAKPMTVSEMKKSEDVLDGFVVDAWLANWDVIGLSADNIVKGPDGQAYRIDPGGALIFRAQGGDKSGYFGQQVKELETLLQPSTNAQAAAVFGDLDKADMKKMAARVTDITDAQIDQAVDEAGIPDTKFSSGIQDLNSWMKKRLKARRDYLTTNLLNWTPPTPMSAEDLAQVADLDKTTLELIAKDGPKLKDPLHPKVDIRKKIVAHALKKALKMNAVEAGKLLNTHWSAWKSSATGNSGNFLRWAAGSNQRSERAAMRSLESFWRFLVKKGKLTDAQRKKIQKTLEENIETDGGILRKGVDVSNRANTALINTHVNHNIKTPKGNKKKLKSEVTVYRGWRPDQVEQMGVKPEVGKKIRLGDSTIHSWSLRRGGAFNAPHGGMFTKAVIPISAIQLTDRLNNTKGNFQSEDEVAFCCPDVDMEVLKAP